jgi:hypothetical protein
VAGQLERTTFLLIDEKSALPIEARTSVVNRPRLQRIARAELKAVVYVADGTVARVRAIEPGVAWNPDDDRGYADIGKALSAPLSEVEIARRLPTLGLTVGDHRPHVKGKIREYISLGRPGKTPVGLCGIH